MIPPDLHAAIRRAARARPLLVACDFDGVLAPIAPTPDAARTDAQVLDALRGLAAMPRVHTAILSGRALDDLRRFVGPAHGITLVGGHGAESEAEPFVLSSAQRELLEQLARRCSELSANVPGVLIEHKPSAAAVHYRLAPATSAPIVRRRILDGPARLPGVFTREGHMVIELSVLPADKGLALARLRRAAGAHAVVYLGDDQTDEDAFAVLEPQDVSIRVGTGCTRARFVLQHQGDVAGVLRELAVPGADSGA